MAAKGTIRHSEGQHFALRILNTSRSRRLDFRKCSVSAVVPESVVRIGRGASRWQPFWPPVRSGDRTLLCEFRPLRFEQAKRDSRGAQLQIQATQARGARAQEEHLLETWPCSRGMLNSDSESNFGYESLEHRTVLGRSKRFRSECLHMKSNNRADVGKRILIAISLA